jgi:hypothetical protein
MKCHHCGSESYRKNGSYRGVQRYICKSCGRSFTSRGERFDRRTKEKALEMYLNNAGIREIARLSGASSTAVIKWIRAAREDLSRQCHRAAEKIAAEWPDVIGMDEIDSFIEKNGNGRPYGLLIVGENTVLFRF